MADGVETQRTADYESTPLARPEYIAAIVHLYRGELYRANSWRMRLDTTTNWAVITTAGLVSFSFGSETRADVILIVGVPLVSIFWAFEARRYRFADIWYARVRKIEENFYGPILRRDPVSPEIHWGELVAEDLFHPRFKISKLEALRHRFLRNYWAIFGIILVAWVVKAHMHPFQAENWLEFRDRLAFGLMPWWGTLAGLGAFLAAIAVLLVVTSGSEPDEERDAWNISP